MNTVTRAIKLKEGGLTIKEVVAQLISEGRTMPNGDPITEWRIRKWVKGVKPQMGRRSARPSRSKKQEAEIIQLKDDAIKLKESGLTIKEVIAQLISEGRTMPNGDPITHGRIYPWIKGINSQTGYRRNGDGKPLTEKEKLIHRLGSEDRRKAYLHKWMQKHQDILTRKLND